MRRNYYQYLLKKNKKILIIQLAILAAIYAYTSLENNQITLFIPISLNGFRLYLYGCAIIWPIYLHIKDYQQNGNDLIVSLPINKEKRYFYDLVFGWLMIMIPYLMLVLIKTLFGTYYPYTTNAKMVLENLLILFPVLVLYLLNALIAVKSNNLQDTMILILIMNATIYILPGLLMHFFSMNNAYNIYELYNLVFTDPYQSVYILPILITIISPFKTISLLQEGMMAFSNSTQWIIMGVIGIYIVFTILLLFLNLISYKNKPIEEYGGKTVSKIGYPFTIILMSFTFITFANTQRNFALACIFYLFIFCIYMGVYFIAERKMSFSLRKVLVYIGIIIFSISLRTFYVYTDGFGTLIAYQSSKDVTKLKIEIDSSWKYSVILGNPNSITDDKDKPTKNIKDAIIKIQNELNNEMKNKNLWWYDNKETYSSITFYYDQGKQGVYSYKISESQRNELLLQLKSLGMIETVY